MNNNNNKIITIGVDFSNGVDMTVISTLRRDGSIEIIDNNSDISEPMIVTLQEDFRYIANLSKPIKKKQLPHYRQIEQRKRKY